MQYDLQNVPARYFDGQTARPREVAVSLTPGAAAGSGLVTISDDTGVVDTWPLERIQAMRDQGHAGLMTVLPYPGATERLVIGDKAAQDTLRRVAPNLFNYRASAGVLRKIGVWAGGAIASILLIVFVIVPAIADQLAVLIPVERERKLGDATISQITWVLGQMEDEPVAFCTNPDGVAALRVMENRLASTFDSPVPITLRVINHDLENAFAVPGGHIVIFDGLLQKATSPEQVAGVVGHEMGHVFHRDPTRMALRTASTAGILGLLLGDFAGGTVVLATTERLIAANYAQDAERAADAFAIQVMTDAGLPTRPFGDFFDRIAGEESGDDGLLSHLASHPNTHARAEAARAADQIGDRSFDPVLSARQWNALRGICAGPSDKNTRN